METGLRKDKEGNEIPRQIINRFNCTFEGQTVIDVAMEPAVLANPFLEFKAAVPASGTFTFKWYNDDGSIYTETQAITIT